MPYPADLSQLPISTSRNQGFKGANSVDIPNTDLNDNILRHSLDNRAISADIILHLFFFYRAKHENILKALENGATKHTYNIQKTE